MEQKNKGSCITFGCEAGGRPNRRERRGARRRRNKVLRGVRHHVRYVGGALGPKDVVLDDERTRACGRRSTTSGTPAAPWAPKTWCLTTKEQGFAGSGAPRPADRRRLGRQRRGARRRKNKGLREAEHHVPQTGGALGPKDVVLDDERTRVCGRRSTTPPRWSPARRLIKKGPTHSRSS